MESVVIFSTANLYYGNSAAVARMNNYARALAFANVDVYLLSTDSLDTNREWMEVEPHIHTLPNENVKIGKFYNPFYVLGLVRKAKKLIKTIKGEVVLLNYPSTKSLLLDLVLLLFCSRYPIFCEVNEVRRYSSGSTGSIRDRLYCQILDRTYRRYKGVVFISRNIQEYYASKVRKSIVVPILSDCDHPFAPSSGLDTFDFVFLGSVSFPKENLNELLEGFIMFVKEHQDARLLLYGILTDANKRRLEEFIEKTNASENIQYRGTLPHENVCNVLSSAGALVLPRANNKQNYYGFSTKLSEYAVSGTPIVMTNTGVVADYFQDGVNCLMCDGYDRNAFKIKFDELAQMSVAEKQQMAENAYRVAQNRFDYRIYSETLKGFLFNSKENEKTF